MFGKFVELEKSNKSSSLDVVIKLDNSANKNRIKVSLIWQEGDEPYQFHSVPKLNSQQR